MTELPTELITELDAKRISYRHIEAILCTYKDGFDKKVLTNK